MNAPSWSLFEDMFWGEVKFKYQLNTMTFSGSLLLLSDTDGPLIWIHWRRWQTQKHNAVLHEGKQTSSLLAENMVWGFFTSQNVSNKKKNIIFVFLQVEFSFNQETATEKQAEHLLKSRWPADARAKITFYQYLAQACNSQYLKTGRQKPMILSLQLKDSFNTSLLSWLSCVLAYNLETGMTRQVSPQHCSIKHVGVLHSSPVTKAKQSRQLMIL